MRIKRLEITGFKSFCNRTVLQFDKPITAVVGPNGCGKSNIVDAIRWCMGEQSPKQLRGKAMDDVIFAGSDSRGPVGMCEVTITFANDGDAPLEYLSYSEISVTRRLYRDGTSEYLLNKTPCRLRDITDFFLGTGVGTRAYSIIEQGRVGMIVSSRPEDRRFLIEEAAGISKFKVKRKLAEKKMEATRHNLLRVSDVLQELDKQLGSLSRQAEKAERYKRHKAELRDLDLWSASHRWLGLCGELGVVEGQRSEISRLESERSQEVLSKETALAAVKVSLVEQEVKLEEMQRRLFEMDNRLQLDRAEFARDRQQAEELTERTGEATIERDGLKSDLDSIEIRRTERQSALSQRQEHLAVFSERVTGLDEVCQGHRQKLADMERHLGTVRDRIGQLQNDIARGEAEARGNDSRLVEYAERLERLSQEAGQLEGERDAVRARIVEAEKVLQTTQQLTLNFAEERVRFESKKETLEAEVGALDVSLNALNAEVQQLKSRKESLEEIQARLEDFESGTRHVVGHKRPEWDVRGVVADFLTAPRHLEDTIEMILSSRLRALVVPDARTAHDVVQLLVEERQGRTTLLPLDQVGSAPGVQLPAEVADRMIPVGQQIQAQPGYEGLIDALFGNVWLVATLEEAVTLRQTLGAQLPAGALLVTTQGEIVEKAGFVHGGSAAENTAGILQRKREIRELDDLLQERTAERATVLADRTRKDHERTDVIKLLERLQQDRHRSEMEILGLESELKRSRDAEERFQHRLSKLVEEREEWRTKGDELRQAVQLLTERTNAARTELIAREDELSQEGQNRLAVLELAESAQTSLTEAKIEFAQFQQEERVVVEEVTRLSQAHAEKTERHNRLCELLVEHTMRAAQLREKADLTEEACNQLATEKQALSLVHAEERGGFEVAREQLVRDEESVRTLRQEADKLTRELGQLELKLTQVQGGIGHLEESIAERYRLQLREELINFHLRPLWQAGQDKRIDELRIAIERIGDVNLQAPEEYKALGERKEFLGAQKSDLEQALAQLERAIEKINETSRSRFQEVFDAVNAKFQELFPRCFRGGQARLVLTNEDNLLESGIEIIAQPPGKKNSSVEVLSGGEKAMTAVALIMAIFLIKPSPFCLLDEVDAPLDEANVMRFGDLIREMTDRSQFIMITHNKRSMQIADALYGVTMQEPGISTLVSVNFAPIEKSVREKRAGWTPTEQAVS